jgi:prepilin-type N-terminal cleavage/methylation domain-containing protein
LNTACPPRVQRGFTLIELSIVIAIGLLLILAGLKFGPSLMRGTQVSAEVQNVGQIVTKTRNLYRGRYANLTTALAIQYDLAPTDLVNGATLAGNWGPMTLAPAALTGAAANTALQLTLQNIPQQVCTQLAPALLGVADELDVGAGVNVKSFATPNPLNDVIAGNCGAVGGSVNIVVRAQ